MNYKHLAFIISLILVNPVPAWCHTRIEKKQTNQEKSKKMAYQEKESTFHFEIITKSGGNVNTSARGHGIEEAKYHLGLQYPGCTIKKSW